jgi:uncharacterized protein YaaN involved in tellurite resistance
MATTTKTRKTTKKGSAPVIDVEATEEVKPSVRRTRKTAAEISADVEAELVGEKHSVNLPKKRISNDGTINTSDMTPAQRKRYTEIAKVLNEKDLTSVTSYGSDLQRAMDTYSSDFLKQTFNRDANIESAELIANLLGELHEVDIDDLEAPGPVKRFLRKIPGVRKLVTSVAQIKAKYDTIEKNIEGILDKLEAGRQIAIRDNNLLEKQFENNCDYVDQLEELIIAGKIKSEELEELLAKMKGNPEDYETYQISDIEEYKNSLDKRIHDLTILRFAFKESLTQIRIIQRTNLMSANNTEAQIALTVPLWKNQLSLAVALYNQKNVIDMSGKVADATNEIIAKNASMLKEQAIQVAEQNQRSVIDIETLRKSTADILATVEGVQKANKIGAEKRANAEAELKKLEATMSQTAIGVAESTHHIISKELKQRKLLEESM